MKTRTRDEILCDIYDLEQALLEKVTELQVYLRHKKTFPSIDTMPDCYHFIENFPHNLWVLRKELHEL